MHLYTILKCFYSLASGCMTWHVINVPSWGQIMDLEKAVCLWLRYITQLAIFLTYYSILMHTQVKVIMISALHIVPCKRSHALCRPANIRRSNTWHLQDAWWDIGRCHRTPNAPTVAPHLCTAVALVWAKRALWAVKKVWSWFTNGRGLCMQNHRWVKSAYSSATALTNTLHVQGFVITSLRSLFTSCAKIHGLCFTQGFVSQHSLILVMNAFVQAWQQCFSHRKHGLSRCAWSWGASISISAKAALQHSTAAQCGTVPTDFWSRMQAATHTRTPTMFIGVLPSCKKRYQSYGHGQLGMRFARRWSKP